MIHLALSIAAFLFLAWVGFYVFGATICAIGWIALKLGLIKEKSFEEQLEELRGSKKRVDEWDRFQ